MTALAIWTYRDAVDHLLDYLGADSTAETRRSCKRAILDAYRELAAARTWQYYYQRGRITTVASYSTGTIAYDHTGGSNERMVTLTSGTWPSWSAFGTVVIDSVAYEVASRISDSIIKLSVNSNPGADVDAGTSFTIYRDVYPLPCDFLAADQLVAMGSSVAYPSYVHPRDWLIPQRLAQTPGTPRVYTFTSDPNYMGAMAVCFHPAPDAAIPFDFIYHRRPRPLVVEDYHDGTVNVSASGTGVTGVGTNWTSKYLGSNIRISDDGTNTPTGPLGIGGEPFDQERVVVAVNSTTSLTVDSAWTTTRSEVKYILSDPIDVEEGAMLNAFWRACEKQIAMQKHLRDKGNVNEEYQEALVRAMESDSRNLSRRVAGGDYRPAYRLADMPLGDNLG